MNERELFSAALEQPTEAERSAYLDDVCAGDPGLRERIQTLLQAERELGSFIELPPVMLAVTVDLPDPAACKTVGPYKLIKPIGEGGFGVVYLAEQTQPVRRKVALKVIKPGMDTKEVIARFEAERQTLALMDHPHIAKVLDCGATDAGLPYFVMELVPGLPITDYCDQNKLTTRERLELFVSVCLSVQHAHHKGIIHRDIKPSNVLVTRHDGIPVPKIIDFGIAKAIDCHLTRTTLLTDYDRMIGTPMYMSPEQAGMCGLDIDTRTDVYSLGVLLYELLTGATPFGKEQLEHNAYDEIRRIIRDEDPVRPSTKIEALGETATAVSAQRQTDPKRLSALLRHDLDWIVMKALEKDRDRRYDTASSFASDIQRYLNDEPVNAYPPSAAYRFAKFARRHRQTLATTAALAAMLIACTMVSVWQAFRAADSERIAIAEAATSRAVLAFINRDLLAAADPSQEPNRELQVREALDRASAKIDGRFPQQPLVEAAIRHTVGTAYLTLGDYGKAEQHLLEAVEIRRQHLGTEDPQTVASMSHLALAVCELGHHQEAEQLHDKVLQINRRSLGAEHPQTLGTMMNRNAAIYQQGRYEEAQRNTVELLRLQRRVLGTEHPETLKSTANLASVKRLLGEPGESEKLCRDLLPIQRRVLREEHPDTVNTMEVLANAVMAQNRAAEAEELHREVYELRSRILGPEHPSTLSSLNNVCVAISDLGRDVEAQDLRGELLQKQRRILGSEHPDTLNSMTGLANLMRTLGRPAEAEALHREVCEARRRVLGEEHPETLSSQLDLATTIIACGRHGEAEESLRALLTTWTRELGPEHPKTLKAMVNLAVAIHQQRRFAEAEQLRRETVAIQTKVLGPEHRDTLANRLNLANAIRAQGRHLEAEVVYREVEQQMQRTLGDEHPFILKVRLAMAMTAKSLGRYVEAEDRLRRVLEVQRRVLTTEHADTLYCMNALAQFLSFSAPQSQLNPAEAVELAEEIVERQPDNGNFLKTLGQAQYRAGNLQEAMQTLNESTKVRGPNHHDTLTLALVFWHLDQRVRAVELFETMTEETMHNASDRRLWAEFQTLMRAEVARAPTPKAGT